MNLSYRPLRSTPGIAEFSRVLNAVNNAETSHQWRPAVDVISTDGGYQLEFDVPGVKAEEIDISVEKDTLTVSGQRKPAEHAGKVLRSERLNGQFQRSFTLSDDVDAESITASFADGVLTLQLARKEAVKPRRIEVSKAT